jgi:outer membrane protein OmpA-like peptidoglycan-associated protein
MRGKVVLRVVAGVVFGMLISPAAADAQLGQLGGIVRGEAERAAAKRIRKVVRCALGDNACVEKAKKDGDPVEITGKDGKVITDGSGQPVASQEQAAAQTLKPGEGVWRNYDFVPGATVWKSTDFSAEPVGRFPGQQIEFVRGNMQTVEFEGEKVLEVSSSSEFRLKLPQALPKGFTLEFDIRIPAPNFATSVYFAPLQTAVARYPFDYVQVYGRPGVYRSGREVSNMYLPTIQDRWVPVKLQVDDTYAILYVGSERVAQVPTANFGRTAAVEFRAEGNQRLRTYLKNIVVAVGVNKMYETLIASGEFTTRGILFDVDSDRLRPESTPALTEILTTLKDHPELQITIEGHTDNQGDDKHNLDLSERRARAVVQYLTGQGTVASRLSGVGKGESVPAVDNATPEGRQQNRRVVIRVRK